jgi:Mitosis protein DIM1
MGSVVLPHLVTGWHVDQAIMSEDERLVIIRFGRDWDPDCMRQDEVLYRKRFHLLFTPRLLTLHVYRYRRSSQELCCHLCVRSRPSSRLQANVW